MVKAVDMAKVFLWDMLVGAVVWDSQKHTGVFEYNPEFVHLDLDISPLHMPLRAAQPGQSFYFPSLNRETFNGLPGLLADSLPDKFGNKILGAWLTSQNRGLQDFSPVEHLCYTGTRGMGALEFRPATAKLDRVVSVDLNAMVGLVNDINRSRMGLTGTYVPGDDAQNAETLKAILRVGTSAGGARAKAVVAMDAEGHILSGQGTAPNGYTHYLLKFDGVSASGAAELSDSVGFGRIEYAYHLMAQAAGINMMPSRLWEENGRSHFLTQRFDRIGNDKMHIQTLCGVAHFDFNVAGAHSYEEVFTVMRKLNLSHHDAIQYYRRLLFNVIARNQDDHPKNTSFVMDRSGKWSLSPAYDLTYAFDPLGRWTSQHQMWIAGKRDDFTVADLLSAGENIHAPSPNKILVSIISTVADWPKYAREAGVSESNLKAIQKTHRLHLKK